MKRRHTTPVKRSLPLEVKKSKDDEEENDISGEPNPVIFAVENSMVDDDDDDDDDELDIPAESRISKTLSEQTIKTVIILVLCLLFLLPLCQIETYNVG